MRALLLAIVLVAGACSHPALLDAPVDAFACPDGAVCASAPDGGCDPQAWQDPATCPAGQVCTSDGVCAGPVCGGGNSVCDPAPANVCARSPNGDLDCVPPCTNAGQVVYRGTSSCFTRGLLIDSANKKCVVGCWLDECSILGDNFCGPPMTAKRLAAARKRLGM